MNEMLRQMEYNRKSLHYLPKYKRTKGTIVLAENTKALRKSQAIANALLLKKLALIRHNEIHAERDRANFNTNPDRIEDWIQRCESVFTDQEKWVNIRDVDKDSSAKKNYGPYRKTEEAFARTRDADTPKNLIRKVQEELKDDIDDCNSYFKSSHKNKDRTQLDLSKKHELVLKPKDGYIRRSDSCLRNYTSTNLTNIEKDEDCNLEIAKSGNGKIDSYTKDEFSSERNKISYSCTQKHEHNKRKVIVVKYIRQADKHGQAETQSSRYQPNQYRTVSRGRNSPVQDQPERKWWETDNAWAVHCEKTTAKQTWFRGKPVKL